MMLWMRAATWLITDAVGVPLWAQALRRRVLSQTRLCCFLRRASSDHWKIIIFIIVRLYVKIKMHYLVGDVFVDTTVGTDVKYGKPVVPAENSNELLIFQLLIYVTWLYARFLGIENLLQFPQFDFPKLQHNFQARYASNSPSDST